VALPALFGVIPFALTVLFWSFCAFSQNSDDTGKWRHFPSKDELYNKMLERIMLYSTAADSTEADNDVIVIHCSADNELRIYVEFRHVLTKNDSLTHFAVSYRIGDNPVQNDTWILSSSGESLFYPGDVEPFISRLKSSDVFIVRVVPESMSSVTAAFIRPDWQTRYPPY